MGEARGRSGSIPSAARRKKSKRKKAKRKARISWWARVSAAVLAAGALAGAATAIIGLWPEPDPVDRVTITSANLLAQPLSDYVATVKIRPLEDAEGADVIEPFAAVPHLRWTGGAATAGPTPSGSGRSTDSPTGTRSATTSSSPTSSSSTGSSPSTTEPTTFAPTTAPTSSSDSPVQAPPAILDVPIDVREQLNDAIVSSPVLEGFVLPDDLPDIPGLVAFALQNAVGEQGQPIPTEEAAQNLSARLERVRTVPSGGRRNPLGVRATVDLEMEGLRGVDLFLYWRLQSAGGATPVPDLWAQATPAFRLTPGTTLDSASVDVWVPLPRAQGPYVLDFLVIHDPQEAPLESFRSDPFD
jgi:hypothetical protein